MAYNTSKHPVACDCSVCWVKHHCDALKLFPDSQSQHTSLFIVNYADNQTIPFSDCDMTPVTTLSGLKA